MREIKFRVWKDYMPGFEYFSLEDMMCSREDDLLRINQSSPSNYEQYTGLKDKNGKEVYEGDIVKMEYELNRETAEGIVIMQDGCWCLDFQHLPEHRRPYDPTYQITRRFDYLKMFVSSIQRTAEVIGNLHEH